MGCSSGEGDHAGFGAGAGPRKQLAPEPYCRCWAHSWHLHPREPPQDTGGNLPIAGSLWGCAAPVGALERAGALWVRGAEAAVLVVGMALGASKLVSPYMLPEKAAPLHAEAVLQ